MSILIGYLTIHLTKIDKKNENPLIFSRSADCQWVCCSLITTFSRAIPRIVSKIKLLSVICSPKNVKLGYWGWYEKTRGASQQLGVGYVRYSSIFASVDGDAYLLFLGAVGEGGHQLPHGLATVGQAAGVMASRWRSVGSRVSQKGSPSMARRPMV